MKQTMSQAILAGSIWACMVALIVAVFMIDVQQHQIQRLKRDYAATVDAFLQNERAYQRELDQAQQDANQAAGLEDECKAELAKRR